MNAANSRIFTIETRGLEGWLVALDGQPLQAVQPAGQLVLGPGERADLVVDVVAPDGERALIVSRERESAFILGTLVVEGSARAKRESAPAPLAPNPVPALGGLSRAREATLRMAGGAMGGLREATLNGREMPIRELATRGKVWALNGLAESPAEPLFTARRGETVLVTMVNDTAWPHGMHLHGHHFRAVSADGSFGPWRDTLLMDREETVRIAFVADNPGEWLLHCHMLEHSVAGMLTWFRIS